MTAREDLGPQEYERLKRAWLTQGRHEESVPYVWSEEGSGDDVA